MKKRRKVDELQPPRTCAGLDQKDIRSLLSLIGDKWTISIIGSLIRHPKKRARFSELEKAINGISQRMLTTTLRELERDGIVTRELFPEVPPRVEYELSPLGRSLVKPVTDIIEWASANISAIESARIRFDQRLLK